MNSKRGIPTHCRCGAKVSFRTSKTITNPGRLFHSCPYGNETNPHHLFKWTDESVVEEIEDLKDRFDEFEQEVLGYAKDIQVLQSEIQNHSLETRSCSTTLQRYKSDIQETTKQLQGLKMELKSLRNLLICAILFGFIYKFIL